VPRLNNSSQKSYRICRFDGRPFDASMEAGFSQIEAVRKLSAKRESKN
jgi:hypothetical protein